MDLQESNVQRQRRRISRLVRENADLAAEVGRKSVTIDSLTADIERMAGVNRRIADARDNAERLVRLGRRENELLTEEIQKLSLELSEAQEKPVDPAEVGE